MGWTQYNPADYVGQRFGRLTVTSAEGPITTSSHRVLLTLACDCGKTMVRAYSRLKYLQTMSCGCAGGTGNRTHGMHKSPEYSAWQKMKERCLNPNSPSFDAYGGRGITVCDAWLGSFEAFLADMGPRPEGYSIERTDVNGNYCPENCIWLPRNLQNKNLRKNLRIEFKGATYNGRELARLLGVSNVTIGDHIRRGNLREWLDRKAAS
jgi:hypothetical protein